MLLQVPGGIELLVILLVALMLFGIPLVLVGAAAFLYIRSQSDDGGQSPQPEAAGGQPGQQQRTDQHQQTDQRPQAGQQPPTGQGTQGGQRQAGQQAGSGQSPQDGHSDDDGRDASGDA